VLETVLSHPEPANHIKLTQLDAFDIKFVAMATSVEVIKNGPT